MGRHRRHRQSVAHEYHRIDDKVLWETATVDLPKLKAIVLRMIAEVES
jgi:uncharacterized protein with HEPN domain